MRENKFRVWDKAMNAWSQNIVCLNLNWNKDDSITMNPFPDHIVCEYTGLKDKNGVEIYEGDFLKVGRQAYAITVRDFHGIRFMWGKDQIVKSNAIDGKVIGNIHKNPELI